MRVLVIDPDPARAALVAEGLSGVEPLEVRHAAIFDETEAALFEPDVVVVVAGRAGVPPRRPAWTFRNSRRRRDERISPRRLKMLSGPTHPGPGSVPPSVRRQKQQALRRPDDGLDGPALPGPAPDPDGPR